MIYKRERPSHELPSRTEERREPPPETVGVFFNGEAKRSVQYLTRKGAEKKSRQTSIFGLTSDNKTAFVLFARRIDFLPPVQQSGL